MTVADLIEYLKTQDQGAIVEVSCYRDGACYEGGISREEIFNPEEHVTYTDFRGNPHVKETAYNYNKRYLLLGTIA